MLLLSPQNQLEFYTDKKNIKGPGKFPRAFDVFKKKFRIPSVSSPKRIQFLNQHKLHWFVVNRLHSFLALQTFFSKRK